MSYWNFREILDVHPEKPSFGCVGTKVEDATRCNNQRPLLHEEDLVKAIEILDSMDRCESLKSSYDYLDELARLTLCIAHSDSRFDQVTQITGIWIDRIVQHMRKEVESNRPKTRRSIARPQNPSPAPVAPLSEVKEAEEEESPAKKPISPTPRKPSMTRQDSSTSQQRKKPTRNVSHKISSLISEVGFHDDTNEKYVASPDSPPSRASSKRSPPPLERRSTPRYMPTLETKEEEMATQELRDVLNQSHTSTQPELKEKAKPLAMAALAERPLAPTSPYRARSATTSSSGSSAGSSKFSHADAISESSAPSSRSSSAKSSPCLGPTTPPKPDCEKFSSSPSRAAAPSSVKSSSVARTVSPDQMPLPKFDFGIYSNLPLPPDHKISISDRKEAFPKLEEVMEEPVKEIVQPLKPSGFQFDPDYQPAPEIADFEISRSSVVADYNSDRTSMITDTLTRMSFASESLAGESFASESLAGESLVVGPSSPGESTIQPSVRNSMVQESFTIAPRKSPIHIPTSIYDSAVLESCDELSEPDESELGLRRFPSVSTVLAAPMSSLPDYDAMSDMGRSWLASPAISQKGSRRVSRSSFSMARTPSSRSRTPSVRPSARSLTRTPSQTIARSASRAMSRRASKASRSELPTTPEAAMEPIERPHLVKKPSLRKEDLIPLHILIQMSQELADRLDGIESFGQVKVRPVTSYKYRLPAKTLAPPSPPVPELRFSRLFQASDPNAFPYAQPTFTVQPVVFENSPRSSFSSSVSRKPVGESPNPSVSCSDTLKIRNLVSESPQLPSELSPKTNFKIASPPPSNPSPKTKFEIASPPPSDPSPKTKFEIASPPSDPSPKTRFEIPPPRATLNAPPQAAFDMFPRPPSRGRNTTRAPVAATKVPPVPPIPTGIRKPEMPRAPTLVKEMHGLNLEELRERQRQVKTELSRERARAPVSRKCTVCGSPQWVGWKCECEKELELKADRERMREIELDIEMNRSRSMERAPPVPRKNPGRQRGATLRKIRKRVVRALTA